MVVPVWLMDAPQVIRAVVEGLKALQVEIKYTTLDRSRETLLKRWKNDHVGRWRNNEQQNACQNSLPDFQT